MRTIDLFRGTQFVLAAACFAPAACSDGGSNLPDAGADAAMDAMVEEHPDAFVRDMGPRVDVGPYDAGFDDPNTISEGVEFVNGLRTYVHVQGTTTSTLPPVIVLHDIMLGHEYLPEHFSFLVSNRLVVFYDMRAMGRTSFGRTTMTTTITADQHALDLHDVVEWVGENYRDSSTVDLIGHGYGAGIASLYASAHPERVGHMLLIAPFPVTATQLADYNAEATSRLTSGERMLINRLVMEPECRGNINMCTIEIWRIAGAHYMCEMNEDLFSMLDFMYGDYRSREFVEFNLRDNTYDWRPLFASITAETTVISGACSPAPVEVAEAYGTGIAGAEHLVFTTSGHFPFVEERDAFQRAALHALRR